jgi:Synaptobrevin/Regulated-SNARE-like domain
VRYLTATAATLLPHLRVTTVVITSKEYPQRNAFKLLGELRNQFEEEFSDEFNSARASGLNKKTKAMFKALADKYENAGGTDRIANVTLQVEEVKGVMQKNINAVLKNRDNLETLLESSSNMRNDASTFQRSAVRVKNKLWWQNVRLMIAIVVLLVALAAVIVVPLVAKKSAATGKA